MFSVLVAVIQLLFRGCSDKNTLLEEELETSYVIVIVIIIIIIIIIQHL